MLRKSTSFLAVLALAATGCEDGTSPGAETGQVSVQFSTASTVAAEGAAQDELMIEGSNGVLTITDIRLIVAEFELEGQEGACDPLVGGDDDDFDDECPDFEAPPSFVDLPLGSGAVEVATAGVPVGTYTGFEFEVEDIDFDDVDEDEQELSDLAGTVRAAFPDWPDEASMMVTGVFDPNTTVTGDERPFTVFFDAEIEVELDFATPLVVTEAGVSQPVTVQVLPELWFARADGTVMDLSALDYGETGELVEFEVEIEDGFDVELDDDDDDD